MFETSFLWQGRVIVFPSVFCSWGRPVNAVRACDAISQGTVPLAQVGKIFTWKRGFRALSSRVGGGPISFAVVFLNSFNYIFLALFQ